MTATLAQALAFAHAEHLHRSEDWLGMCQRFTRSCWGVAAKYGYAALAWEEARFKHTSWPPAPGAPTFWTGGPNGYGHAALSIGDGTIWSTDILRRSEVDRVGLALITERWGLHYAGWAEDINDIRVIVVGAGGEGGEHEPIKPSEEDPPMRYIKVVAGDPDPNIYGYTDDQWWVASVEEAGSFGITVRGVNDRQRDLIRVRVQAVGRARAEATRPVVRREATDGASRTFQAWIGGQVNAEFDGAEVAQIKTIGAKAGVLGELFPDE